MWPPEIQMLCGRAIYGEFKTTVAKILRNKERRWASRK